MALQILAEQVVLVLHRQFLALHFFTLVVAAAVQTLLVLEVMAVQAVVAVDQVRRLPVLAVLMVEQADQQLRAVLVAQIQAVVVALGTLAQVAMAVQV
jgi:hypothetical protein